VVFSLIPIILIGGTAASLAIQTFFESQPKDSQTVVLSPKSQAGETIKRFSPFLIIIVIVFILIMVIR